MKLWWICCFDNDTFFYSTLLGWKYIFTDLPWDFVSNFTMALTAYDLHHVEGRIRDNQAYKVKGSSILLPSHQVGSNIRVFYLQLATQKLKLYNFYAECLRQCRREKKEGIKSKNKSPLESRFHHLFGFYCFSFFSLSDSCLQQISFLCSDLSSIDN